jgi:hypothetical protein
MKLPSKEKLEYLRSFYARGRIVVLGEMKDAQAPPPGTYGEIQGVDDAGNILVRWDNGSHLSLILDVDTFFIVKHRPEDIGE